MTPAMAQHTPRIIKLLDDLADTMYYENRGIGIAAPQVGVLRRVFVVDIGDDHATRAGMPAYGGGNDAKDYGLGHDEILL